jgi:hypothetical protein
MYLRGSLMDRGFSRSVAALVAVFFLAAGCGSSNDSSGNGACADLWYIDADGDGFGLEGSGVESCTAPEGRTAGTDLGFDCDDTNPDVFPGAPEAPADGLDADCSGQESCYVDDDRDGWGSSDLTEGSFACDQPGEAALPGDCNDADASVHPTAEDVCDEVDNDCDGEFDENILTWYPDADGDGYGDPSSPVVTCDPPSGWVTDGTDCDDQDADIHPGAEEICADHLDNDCDGFADEIWAGWPDADGDGWGDAAGEIVTCSDPDGLIDRGGDCDDADADVHPEATEIVADGVDQDCDGYELCWWDSDRDGSGDGDVILSADLDCSDPGESTDAG